jgi:hypothetical protein
MSEKEETEVMDLSGDMSEKEETEFTDEFAENESV